MTITTTRNCRGVRESNVTFYVTLQNGFESFSWYLPPNCPQKTIYPSTSKELCIKVDLYDPSFLPPLNKSELLTHADNQKPSTAPPGAIPPPEPPKHERSDASSPRYRTSLAAAALVHVQHIIPHQRCTEIPATPATRVRSAIASAKCRTASGRGGQGRWLRGPCIRTCRRGKDAIGGFGSEG